MHLESFQDVWKMGNHIIISDLAELGYRRVHQDD